MTAETEAHSGLEAVAAALRRRDAKTAALLAEFELGKGIQHPMLFTARAVALAEGGRHQEALADFKRASQLSPSNPGAWSAEGICLVSLSRFEEAAEAFDKAVKLQPNSAILHCRKGRALEQAQSLAAAKSAYLRALELEPGNLLALGRLAVGAAQQGAPDEARAYADRALRLDPLHQTARLARIMADIQSGDLDSADRSLTDFLGDKAITEQSRVLALGELGDLRDRQGRIDEAFQAYAQANLLSQRLPVAPTTATGTSMSAVVEMLTAYFDGRERSAPPPSRRMPFVEGVNHVFLMGFLRSGTTLFERLLGSHPDVVTLEEKGPIADAVGHFMAQPQNLDVLYRAPEEILDEHRDRYWRKVRSHGIDPTNKTFVDKGPIYTVDLPVIMRLFPDAKILFALRDPRDVVWSCFRSRFELNSTTFEFLNLEGAAKFYSSVMRLAEIYRAVLPMELHELRHETFVGNFELEARKLCGVLGIDWDKAMLNFADNAKLGAISSASGPQIARGLNQEGVGRWRRYADHLAPALPILQPWIEKFGYEP